uniref:Uncharacterized protein n=1 Tax=Panagrolaimus sp. ES5 TaxID=591445 RepID=A0AC34EZK6_9BILA
MFTFKTIIVVIILSLSISLIESAPAYPYTNYGSGYYTNSGVPYAAISGNWGATDDCLNNAAAPCIDPNVLTNPTCSGAQKIADCVAKNANDKCGKGTVKEACQNTINTINSYNIPNCDITCSSPPLITANLAIFVFTTVASVFYIYVL